MSRSRAVADLTAGTILATVDIAAPPERVFQALSSDEISRWWGSDGSYCTSRWSGDLRVGGRWLSEGKSADGSSFTVGGEFLEIDRPRRLVHTWVPDWDPTPTRVTYTLDPIPTGTRLTLRHDGFTQPESTRNHSLGWEQVLSWLDGYASPARKPFLVRLIGPRPTFALDMNAEERAIMMEHGAFWRARLAEGVAVAFGPVADPKGSWGLGLVLAADEAAVRALEKEDPAPKSGRGFHYEVVPMFGLVH